MCCSRQREPRGSPSQGVSAVRSQSQRSLRERPSVLGSFPHGLYAVLPWVLKQFSDGLITIGIIIITLFIIIIIILHFKLSAKALQLKSPRQQGPCPALKWLVRLQSRFTTTRRVRLTGHFGEPVGWWGTRTQEGRVSIATSGVTLSSKLGGWNERSILSQFSSFLLAEI